MKNNFYIILSLFLFISAISTAGCKDKKDHPMIDMESIDYDGSRNERHIFREELKREEEKKTKSKKFMQEE